MMQSVQFGNSRNKRLGEILVGRNILAKRQLRHALLIQKESKQFIGEVLTGLGYVAEKDVVCALIEQKKFPYIAVDKLAIDPSIVGLVSKDKALEYCALPFAREGNIISIVMANPMDGSIKNEFKDCTQCQIAAFISTKSEITRAIERSYA
ncbi:MAG: hypothetical protein K8S27_13240 [Candidatus Omnitrophica bacterium]|nr:hypothetical protein [Candidatus Omnitrophota bacterium]